MNQARAYNSFFLKTEEGRQFIQDIEDMINTAHLEAEKHPEVASSYTSEAKGVRRVLTHIQSITTEIGDKTDRIS